MNKATSIYLDLVRFIAAALVFVAHANDSRFTGNLPLLWRISNFGHEAVMVFFVLSGFVIAYVADGKEKTIDDFFISRFARLYSVVIPALILTVTLDFIGSQIAYEPYYSWLMEANYPASNVLANLFFVNEIWFSSVLWRSNIPFWSIGYEFWYYVLFGLAFYLKSLSKYLFLAIACFLVGPKILLLLPVWLMGVLAYTIARSEKVSERCGWMLVLASAFGYWTYMTNGVDGYMIDYAAQVLGSEFYTDLSWSSDFIVSYVFGVLISLNFIGVAAVSHRFVNIADFFSRPIRYLASYSFTLYLLHYPLLVFFSALTFNHATAKTVPAVVVGGTLSMIFLLQGVTEKKKHAYKRLFTNIWRHVSRGPDKDTTRAG